MISRALLKRFNVAGTCQLLRAPVIDVLNGTESNSATKDNVDAVHAFIVSSRPLLSSIAQVVTAPVARYTLIAH